ncbi:hypothetical protein BDY24DRAFT_429610 [Mrakia frigida]|uniref:uncharacterized protein n=1 Tax=Mrakia frigida TaxID=29902 RepID=UPI003FCC01BE
MRSLLSSLTLALVASVAYASPIPLSNVEARNTLGSSPTSPSRPGSGLSIDLTTTLKVLGARSSIFEDRSGDAEDRRGFPLIENEGLFATGTTALGRFLAGHLSGFKGSYQWTAPSGWVRPTSYEFGFFHPTTGAWVNSQVEVLAFLKRLAFIKLPIDDSASLFPLSAGYYPIRSLDKTRRNHFGFFNQDDVFVDLESEIDASILLGLCGYVKALFSSSVG